MEHVGLEHFLVEFFGPLIPIAAAEVGKDEFVALAGFGAGLLVGCVPGQRPCGGFGVGSEGAWDYEGKER